MKYAIFFIIFSTQVQAQTQIKIIPPLSEASQQLVETLIRNNHFESREGVVAAALYKNRDPQIKVDVSQYPPKVVSEAVRYLKFKLGARVVDFKYSKISFNFSSQYCQNLTSVNSDNVFDATFKDQGYAALQDTLNHCSIMETLNPDQKMNYFSPLFEEVSEWDRFGSRPLWNRKIYSLTYQEIQNLITTTQTKCDYQLKTPAPTRWISSLFSSTVDLHTDLVYAPQPRSKFFWTTYQKSCQQSYNSISGKNQARDRK